MQAQTWQLIVSTIAGFLIAFLAEPVKVYFVERAAQKQLRKALYREMTQLYVKWIGLLELIDNGSTRLDQLNVNIPLVTTTDCYTYAKTKPVEFFALQEASVLDSVYGNFLLVGSKSISGQPTERLQYARLAVMVIENCIRRNEIDSKFLLRLADAKNREMLTDMLRTPAQQTITMGGAMSGS
jgi:hypothetical protein